MEQCLDRPAALLSVLAALQSRPVWTGPELAEQLDVTVRTVRRDIDRLRQLGYQVDSDPGVSGGYRLGVGGSAVPPLMLDTDEAFALAVLVRAADRAEHRRGRAAGGRQVGAHAAVAVAPRRRAVVDGHPRAAVRGRRRQLDPAHDQRCLSRLRRAGRALPRSQRRATERRLLPYRVVSIGRRWYLVARDARLPEWRTWRIDRVASAEPTGHRFTVDDPPDAVELVQRSISTAPYRHQARIELDAPVEQIAAKVPASVGVLEAIDEHTTLMTTGGDNLDMIAFHIGLLDVDFRVLEPEALRVRMHQLAARLLSDRPPR